MHMSQTKRSLLYFFLRFEKLECNRIPVRSSGLGLATGVEDPRIVV